MMPLKYLGFLLGVWSIFACSRQAPEASDKPEAYLALSLEERQSPDHATDAMEVADGLEVTLFAAEPMVVNPTNMAIDARGRVWVCESYNYAVPKEEQQEPGGRITILEDTTGDGRADLRTVFYQGEDVHLALGIGVFGSQVFVTRSPHLLIFTDVDGDDVPERKDTLFTGMGGPGDHSAHAVVFGPDGRFYGNYGNAGQQVQYPDGSVVVDMNGNPVRSDGQPFHGGMVFRFAPSGEDFEVLAHNFRNNYEVGIDAFGTLWQSDNDDDGNRSVRINYVMEYGNYGYLDERTGAHWAHPRIGMHDTITSRHWHQRDPGVVPNLLITGAGSPAGITVYEGSLLPEVFHGQMIHADAGPNVVRAYPVKSDGAGYKAEIVDLLSHPHDQWFRPVDVATAPDGSVFVADWYDPIVGGAAAGDHTRGRLFRLAPPNTPYQVDALDLESETGLKLALSSPNQDIQYRTYQHLLEQVEQAEPLLRQIFSQRDHLRLRARALWLLARLPEQGLTYIQRGLQNAAPEIRIVALRALRQIQGDVLSAVETLVEDPEAQLRREAAIALRFAGSEKASRLWARLASLHSGDRWYLEALGIGADLWWPERLAAWIELESNPLTDRANRDIIWRSRAPASGPLLIQCILHADVDSLERLRYFRAFHWLDYPGKDEDLLSLLEKGHPEQMQINAAVFQLIDPEHTPMSPNIRNALEQTLDASAGTWQYVDLVEKFGLTNKAESLLQLARQVPENEAGFAAMHVLASESWQQLDRVAKALQQGGEESVALVMALKGTVSAPVMEFLKTVTLDTTLDLSVREQAIRSLGASWWGEDVLLETVKDPAFSAKLEPVAAAILFSVYRTSIHTQAAHYLDRPVSGKNSALDPIRVLVATSGNATRGAAVFGSHCQTCHRVGADGISFGPDLTVIGDKLDAEGLYRSIIYPNEGVSYGYESYTLNMKDGGALTGLLASQTEEQVELNLPGGISRTIQKEDIDTMQKEPYSLMPDLIPAMGQEDLIDLVSYLQTLREPT